MNTINGGGGLVTKSGPTLATPWPVVWGCSLATLLSVGFSRQEYWSGFPFPSPRDLPDPGIKPKYAALQADFLLTELQGKFSSVQSLSRVQLFGTP